MLFITYLIQMCHCILSHIEKVLNDLIDINLLTCIYSQCHLNIRAYIKKQTNKPVLYRRKASKTIKCYHTVFKLF